MREPRNDASDHKSRWEPPWELRRYYAAGEKLDFPEITPEEEKALFILAKTDENAKELVIRRHLLYALKLGRRFCSQKLPGDETTSAANEAMMNALKRFDPEHGASFRSFLIPYVRAAIAKCWRSREIVDYKHSTPPPPREPDTKVMAGQDLVALPTLEQEDHDEYLRNQILELSATLEERERTVIHLHYVECLDLAAIGRQLKLSRQRVHQIHKEILLRLRKKLESRGIKSSQ